MRDRWVLAAVTAFAALLPGWPTADTATASGPTFQTGLIPPQHIILPEGASATAVVLISNADGWTNAEEARAQALAKDGAAVIGIDLPAYMTALAADDGECIYMISDIESLSHQVQRATSAQSYAAPILAGIGEGGALALAMMAQSPAATIGAAIAVDPEAGIALVKPLCTPAPVIHTADRAIYGLTKGTLPAPITVLYTKDAPPAGRDHVASIQKLHPDVESRDTPDVASDALTKALADRIAALANAEDPLGLPISVLDTKPTMDTMAIILSGDGGWRDLDKQVGGYLQKKGIPVIGLDSLRYFWSERKPQETADDLSRIIEAYSAEWGVHHILLAGYSFGADVLPATFNLLPDSDKAQVAQITLMAVTPEVSYEVSVEGWLGVDGGTRSPAEDIVKIDPKLIQCIYGTDETDDICPTIKDPGIETIAITGGHHFDEDYKSLTDRILTSLKTRLAQR